jgi:copper oxidase (laccase) domain-containing protein
MKYLRRDLGRKTGDFAYFDFLEVGQPSDGLRPPPTAILSLASAGDMRYRKGVANPLRIKALARLGYDEPHSLAIELHHTRRVILAGNERNLEKELLTCGPNGADGLLCDNPTCVVSVTVADCMPIWIYDMRSGIFGVLHSGWKGTGILGNALDIIQGETGSDPSTVSVILGPSIGRCCYYVPNERAHVFASEFGENTVWVSMTERGEERYSIDLRKANIDLARRLHIGSLLDVDVCTCCDTGLGSYRREGAACFTRMLAACGHAEGNSESNAM